MKTILAVSQISNKGKSETLREFANLLLATYPSYRSIVPIPGSVPFVHDFRLVVEINGKIIGIESKGDPNTKLQDRLIDLTDNFNCDVILCTTRTRGDTVYAVDHLYHTRGFQTIWTSTYQIADKSVHLFVNQMKAKHILELLQGLSII